MNEVYLKPVGRLIVGGITTFFLVGSADLAGSGNMGLRGLSPRIVLAVFIVFQLVLGIGIWQENMVSESQAGEPRWHWLILVILDMACLAIGSLTTAIYLLPRPVRAPVRGLTVEYLAIGASLQAFVYLVFLIGNSWPVIRSWSRQAEAGPRVWQPAPVPQGLRPSPRSRPPSEGPGPGPRGRPAAPTFPEGNASRSRPARLPQALAAVLAIAVTSMPIVAGWFGPGPAGIALAAAACAAAALAAARNTGQ